MLSTDKIELREVIVFPEVIANLCNRNKIKLVDLLDYKVATRYLSAKDRAIFLIAQSSLYLLRGDKADSDFITTDNSLLNRWLSQTTLEEINKLDSSFYLSEFSEMYLRSSGNTATVRESVDIYDVDRNTIALVLKPGQIVMGDNSSEANNFYIRAVEGILKQLYAYLPQTYVNSSIWFKYYIDLLSRQPQVAYN